MKKLSIFASALALMLCGTFTSCSVEDNAAGDGGLTEVLDNGDALKKAVELYGTEDGVLDLSETDIEILVIPEGDEYVIVEPTTIIGNGKLTLIAKSSLFLGSSLTLKNLKIDASELENPLFLLDDEPTAEFLKKADGTNTDYYGIDNITLNNVEIKGVKNSLIWDSNKKYCVVALNIENSVIELATEGVKNEAIISFQAGGVKDFTIKNSTVYGNNAVAKYFIRYNNGARLDRYGFDKNTEFQTMDYENNTFHGLLKSDGQWGNYNGISGQAYSKFIVKNNIWNDCGKDIIRRMAGGRFNGSNPMEFENNTYWNGDAANDESGYDKSGTALTTDPAFEDEAKADFTPTGADQVAAKTGDPRWFE